MARNTVNGDTDMQETKTPPAAQAPKPAPGLKPLERLVGTWKVTGDTKGELTYEWMKGGHFLIARGIVEQDGKITEHVEPRRHPRLHARGRRQDRDELVRPQRFVGCHACALGRRGHPRRRMGVAGRRLQTDVDTGHATVLAAEDIAGRRRVFSTRGQSGG